ncbi:UDP-2,4-diacetamido-2,4,6-trideoxy-beta-L-altropyranose hydrolase [Solibacillus sp. CAU 1738]|uniref:UDP-2,4-diacetamido-2,4, 6-trideoxy-beta-L-altropyranose hydrolase n=1 Tax=Solibacillus sp. CAU 1738 TaxID=3140363 RepID=UPI0032606299
MNVFIRVDASVEIGTGHVMRCLTLAHRLKKEGKTVAFICRGTEGDCIELIEQQGFQVYQLSNFQGTLWAYVEEQWEKDAKETIDILCNFKVAQLIIDHYSIDIKWEQLIRPFTEQIMVIDDLANRQHDCDILLDQNFYLNMETRYEALVPLNAKLLLGPTYALLREEFIEEKMHIRPFNGKLERLFIFFGGSDPTNETEKVLFAIKPIIERYKLSVDVVVGNSNPNKLEIKQICDKIENAYYYCQVNNIAQLMAQADLAIGAGGATTWERIFLELPSIVIAVAQNQIEVAKAVASTRAIFYLGTANEVNREQVLTIVEHLYRDTTELIQIKQNCSNLMS